MLLKSMFLAMAVAGVSGAALAGDFKPVPHGTYTVDFDTADGNFSLWETKELSDINALKAHITFARKGKDKTYAPAFTVRLTTGAKDGQIQFMAAPKSGPLYTTVSLSDDGKEISRDMVLTMPEFGEGFDLYVRWTPEGKVSFDVYDKANASIAQGFEHHEVDLGAAVTGLEITNSTGEVEIKPLQLGRDS